MAVIAKTPQTLVGLALTAPPVIIVAILGATLSGGSTDLWYSSLQKPPFTPPGIAFAVVWPVLYALMIIGACMAWRRAGDLSTMRLAYPVFLIQLVFNLAWSALFFHLQLPLLAFLDLLILWVLIGVMIVALARHSRLAALLQLPYLAWVTFAGYLNFGIIVLN